MFDIDHTSGSKTDVVLLSKKVLIYNWNYHIFHLIFVFCDVYL